MSSGPPPPRQHDRKPVLSRRLRLSQFGLGHLHGLARVHLSVHARGLLFAVGLGLVPAGSHAQEPAPPEAPSVAPSEAPAPQAPAPTCTGRHIVLLSGQDVPAELAREVQTDLSAELERRGLAVCPEGVGTLEPAAVVHLSFKERDAIIELDDRTTQKRVARDVRLDRVPPAGRALALAIAIDELLRASWAELTMREHQAREPSEPEAAADAPLAEPPVATQEHRGPLSLGAALGYLHSWQELDAFSAQLDLELALGRHAFVGFDVGPLLGLPVDGALGSVSTLGVSSSLRVGGCLWPSKRVQACAGARAALEWLRFAGDARAQARAFSGTAWLARVEGMVGLRVLLASRLTMRADVGLGAPLHGVRASDGEHTLVGATGALLSSQLTLQVPL